MNPKKMRRSKPVQKPVEAATIMDVRTVSTAVGAPQLPAGIPGTPDSFPFLRMSDGAWRAIVCGRTAPHVIHLADGSELKVRTTVPKPSHVLVTCTRDTEPTAPVEIQIILVGDIVKTSFSLVGRTPFFCAFLLVSTLWPRTKSAAEQNKVRSYLRQVVASFNFLSGNAPDRGAGAVRRRKTRRQQHTRRA